MRCQNTGSLSSLLRVVLPFNVTVPSLPFLREVGSSWTTGGSFDCCRSHCDVESFLADVSFFSCRGVSERNDLSLSFGRFYVFIQSLSAHRDRKELRQPIGAPRPPKPDRDDEILPGALIGKWRMGPEAAGNEIR